MENQVHYLLMRSDPIISSVSFKRHKSLHGNLLDQEVLDLLDDQKTKCSLLPFIFLYVLNCCSVKFSYSILWIQWYPIINIDQIYWSLLKYHDLCQQNIQLSDGYFHQKKKHMLIWMPYHMKGCLLNPLTHYQAYLSRLHKYDGIFHYSLILNNISK